jgi:hypothetical protein
MSSARLVYMRSDQAPKCATCGWWAGRDGIGPAALCEQHNVKTLDLAVCSGWREHEVFTGEIVREEENPLDGWRNAGARDFSES